MVTQPVLGRVGDVSGYPLASEISAIIQLGAIPFVLAARSTRAASDMITR